MVYSFPSVTNIVMNLGVFRNVRNTVPGNTELRVTKLCYYAKCVFSLNILVRTNNLHSSVGTVMWTYDHLRSREREPPGKVCQLCRRALAGGDSVVSSSQNFSASPGDKFGRRGQKYGPFVILYKIFDVIWTTEDNYSVFMCVKKLKISHL